MLARAPLEKGADIQREGGEDQLGLDMRGRAEHDLLGVNLAPGAPRDLDPLGNDDAVELGGRAHDQRLAADVGLVAALDDDGAAVSG